MSAPNKNLQVIGPTASVSFVNQAINHVPAKVDTGADSSSVWASEIVEKGGTLKFVLFDKTAPWYNGQQIQTKNYTISSVKNSFGSSELRYKVQLSIILHERKIKVGFTLANRANNRYPLLIGRRTLNSRFVVDVARAKKEKIKKPKQILMLVHRGNEKIQTQISSIIKKSDDKLLIDIVKYQDLAVTIDSKSIEIINIQNDKNLSEYKFIHFLTRVRDSEMAAIVATYAARRGIAYADQAAGLLFANAKAHQTAMLSGHNIAIPKTVYLDKIWWKYRYDELRKSLGSPFIFKDNHGLKGRNNFLIKNKKQFEEACRVIEIEDLQMIAQQYIVNDGYFRILVLGKSIDIVVFRNVDSAQGHTYLRSGDNLPRLLNMKDVSLIMQQVAINSADILSLDVAGVDIVHDQTSDLWYCLEVNNSPQLVGASFVDEKIEALSRYFLRKTGK